MSLPTTDAIFAQVRAVAQTYIEYPFIELGDNATKVYHMVCQQNRDDYNAAQIALDATMVSAASAGVISLPFTADANAYFVGDFGHSPIDGGLVEFERVFSNIPATRSGEFTGTQSFTYPGYNTNGDTSGTSRTITSESDNGSITTLNVTNTLSVGDVVYIEMTWTGDVGVVFAGYRVVLTGTTSSIVKVALISGGTTFDSGTLVELAVQPRAQESKLTGSITDFTYYLPGVTDGITTPSDVTEDETFSILDTNTLTATSIMTATTIPNYATYQTQVDAGEYIILNSRVTRWKGNILQKANLKVRAL
jgi:hypothetical protein